MCLNSLQKYPLQKWYIWGSFQFFSSYQLLISKLHCYSIYLFEKYWIWISFEFSNKSFQHFVMMVNKLGIPWELSLYISIFLLGSYIYLRFFYTLLSSFILKSPWLVCLLFLTLQWLLYGGDPAICSCLATK